MISGNTSWGNREEHTTETAKVGPPGSVLQTVSLRMWVGEKQHRPLGNNRAIAGTV